MRRAAAPTRPLWALALALFDPVRRLLQLGCATARVLVFAAITLISALSATICRLVLHWWPETHMRIGLWHVHTFLRWSSRVFGLLVRVHGTPPATGSLIVSNHRSYLDIAAIGSTVVTGFLSKAAIARWPVLGAGARMAGVLFVQRDCPDSRKAAAASVVGQLAAGLSVVNFPEGTTSALLYPGPFRPGLFRLVAGSAVTVQPAHIRYARPDADWTGDATFIDHLFGVARSWRTPIDLTYCEPVPAAAFTDGPALAEECRRRIWDADRLRRHHLDTTLSWLKPPWLKARTYRIRRGRYRLCTFDQPGRWMRDEPLADLAGQLRRIAQAAMDQIPDYGVFSGKRAAFANRVIAVLYDAHDDQPVGFTAMVYLPFETDGGLIAPLIHLGLTVIDRQHRGQRLQTPLFKKAFVLPFVNQRKTGFVVTNIAASPAGIGAMSDYFQRTYPTYRGDSACTPFHLSVAKQILDAYRSEFGCSINARFDPSTFVVHGSNDPQGGGAHQFITQDPISRYRNETCNNYCRHLLDFAAGDELFQVGCADLFRGNWASRHVRRRMKTRGSLWSAVGPESPTT